jgi:hypothetical protein
MQSRQRFRYVVLAVADDGFRGRQSFHVQEMLQEQRLALEPAGLLAAVDGAEAEIVPHRADCHEERVKRR